MERFLSKIKKTERGCWEWAGARHVRGYGKFWLNGCQKAHRISWELFKGRIPKDTCVLHKCDNPPCVNPDHLFLGTQKDNIRDMHKKRRGEKIRRMSHASDETHQVSKLTNKEVRFIRSSTMTIKELEKKLKYKVKALAIIRVKTRETYRDVK